ncbi:MAG: rod shape-determining protein MreC [Bacteroidaceae bacterium]|nr:rod shape-determining protein MreC [Bacteroidaceae bacterium]
MRSLLDFIVRHSYVFLFILLETLSLVLLFGFNDRQKEWYLTSSNSMSGTLFEWRAGVEQYFSLRKENSLLVNENAGLRSLLYELTDSQNVEKAAVMSSEGVIAARVIDNSVRRDDNYITINKGQRDGIAQGMGVYSPDGVVGVVMVAGSRYSVVMPVLNGNTSISCKVKGSDNFGFLEWQGGDPYVAQLRDMPYHSAVEKGDTIVTTGFSSVFPENIPVGTVSSVEHARNGYTLRIEVQLAVDMSDLGWVYVHSSTLDPEIGSLYEQIGR